LERTDQELIDDTLAGKLEAYDALMKRYQGLAYKLASGLGRDREATLDITQNAFLKAYNGLRSFRRNSNFKTWLARIVHNEGINWIRRERVRGRGREPMPESVASPGKGQESEFLTSERKEQLIGALQGLKENHRMAVMLRYFEGMQIREVAEVLGCSEGTVKSILFRSVRRLKDSLTEA
jgi:RNA polymerase sigma-70 factor (ECF subfamily)